MDDILVNDFLEDVVHHCLECHWTVSETKNMTRGSNRPWLVQKAAFHLSPYLIHKLLYPYGMYISAKYFTLAVDILMRISEISRRG